MTSDLFKTQYNWSIHLHQSGTDPPHNLLLVPTSFVFQRTIPSSSQYTLAISILLKPLLRKVIKLITNWNISSSLTCKQVLMKIELLTFCVEDWYHCIDCSWKKFFYLKVGNYIAYKDMKVLPITLHPFHELINKTFTNKSFCLNIAGLIKIIKLEWFKDVRKNK